MAARSEPTSRSASGKRRLALLIDGENIAARFVGPILAALEPFGTTTARRVYGDWTEPQNAGWRETVNAHALIPVQQFRLSTGKNATDCALIVDAMDLLYSGHFDGFGLASSDSDFTRLACRLRESGRLVVGLGEWKVPAAFARSCDHFVRLGTPHPPPPAAKQILNSAVVPASVPPVGPKAAPAPNALPSPLTSGNLKRLQSLVRSAYQAAAKDDGWVHVSELGSHLKRISPGFKPKAYGHKRLNPLLADLGLFEFRQVPGPGHPGVRIWFVRMN